MKKLIIASLFLAAAYTVSAQEVKVVKMESSGTYSGYAIPDQIKIKYHTLYGDPALATWAPMDGWWHATIMNQDNRIVHVYYPTDEWYMVDVPDRDVFAYRVALPQINTHVPESVITTAMTKHGNIYSITQMKSGAYQVGVIENGVLKMVTMDE